MLTIDMLSTEQVTALDTMAKSIRYDLETFVRFLGVFWWVPDMFGGALASKLQEAKDMLKADFEEAESN